jgi:glycosyltransferase involved in cell wall biosynthesis
VNHLKRKKIGVVIGDHTDGRDLKYFGEFKNHDIKFIGRYNKNDEQYARERPINIELIKHVYKKLIPDAINRKSFDKYDITALVYIKDLEKMLKDVDIIYTGVIYSSVGYQCAKIAKKLNRPLVIFEWETIANHLSKWLPPYCFWGHYVAKNVDLVLAMTNRVKRYTHSLGIPDNKVTVNYPGNNLDQFVPNFARRDQAKVRILSIGRLTEAKGFYELAEAFSNLYKKYQNIELWICGRGELENFLREKAENLPIIYKGFLKNEELPAIFASCDIFCLASKDRQWGPFKIWEEQFGFVFTEAMAAGLPIVTTNNGAIPEIVGENNLIVSQGNAQELENALEKYVQDENLRSKVACLNRERALKLFDFKKQAARMEEVISAISYNF